MQTLKRGMGQSFIDSQDAIIRQELEGAGIEPRPKEVRFSENVGCSISGKLGGVSFRRLPEAWEVTGLVKAAAADELRQHPQFGKTIIWPDWVKPGQDIGRMEITTLTSLKVVADTIRKHQL